MVLCTFCGYGACKDCTKKERFFPLSEVKSKLHEQRGTVCKLCDRKFFVRGMVDITRKEIDANNTSIQSYKVIKQKIKDQVKEEHKIQNV